MQNGDEEETEDGEYGGRRVEVAEGDSGGGAGDDDAGIAESDEGDEEADASADCGVELIGDGGEEALPDTRVGECKEDDAGEEDGAEGGLPRDVHAFDDGIGEVGVEAHAGRESERVVGEGSHEDAAECGAEAGCGCDSGERHAGFGEDGRVDEDDVGHRDEGGEAREDLGAPVGAVGGEAEVVGKSLGDSLVNSFLSFLRVGADGGQVGLLRLGNFWKLE